MDDASGSTDSLDGLEGDGMGQASAEALRMALCVVSEPVLVIDTWADRIVDANPSACSLVGLSMAEVRRVWAGDVLNRIGLGKILHKGGGPG